VPLPARWVDEGGAVLDKAESRSMAKKRILAVVVILLVPTILSFGCNRLEATLVLGAPLRFVSGYVLGFLQGASSVRWVAETRCYRNGEPIDCSEVPGGLPTAGD